MHRRLGLLLLVLISSLGVSCGGVSGSGAAAAPPVTPPPPPPAPSIAVVVTPFGSSVSVGQALQFTAVVTGATNTAVTWQINGVTGGGAKTGTVTSSGLFSAPSAVPVAVTTGQASKTSPVTVQAVSQEDSRVSGSVVLTVTSLNQLGQPFPTSLGVTGSNTSDTSLTPDGRTRCCGGTLGALVSRGGRQFILSNNHILARSDLGAIGETIVQPGLIDSNCSGSPDKAVATLSQFVRLDNPDGTAVADAALAEVKTGGANPLVDPLGSILQLGDRLNGRLGADGLPHAGSGVAVSVGRPVAKSGRSTGLTCSAVQSIEVAVRVEYQKGCGTGSTFSAVFGKQVQIAGGDFSAQGDSGSLIVTQDTADPVALLYAGNDRDTVGNPVSDVLSALADPTTGEKPVFVGMDSAHPVAACSLPGPAAATSASAAVTETPSSAQDVERALRVRDRHSRELLSRPEIDAVGAGSSLDEPGSPALLLVAPTGSARTAMPAEIDGVRTRIIEAERFEHRGLLSLRESAELERLATREAVVSALPTLETARARQVHTRHVNELMNLPGVQGVGVTSSADNPGEAALMIFVVRGEAHPPIPATIDGLRTRIRESSPFLAGYSDLKPGASCSASPSKSIKAAPMRRRRRR